MQVKVTKHALYDPSKPLYVLKRGSYNGVEKLYGDEVDVSFLHPAKIITLIRCRHLSHTKPADPKRDVVASAETLAAIDEALDDDGELKPDALAGANAQVADDEAESEPASHQKGRRRK